MIETKKQVHSVGGVFYEISRDNDFFCCEVDANGVGSCSSNLKDGDWMSSQEDDDFKDAIDGLESVYLALACAGVDITDQAHAESFFVALDVIANNLVH